MSIHKFKNTIKEEQLPGMDVLILLVNRLHFLVVGHPPEVKPTEIYIVLYTVY